MLTIDRLWLKRMQFNIDYCEEVVVQTTDIGIKVVVYFIDNKTYEHHFSLMQLRHAVNPDIFFGEVIDKANKFYSERG